ncbi:MAG TPA: hypothetical protein VK850_11040 [Candidatus Binatia bacterium]|nr:hypothetical protein [Candidatus Binatia bacterium]
MRRRSIVISAAAAAVIAMIAVAIIFAPTPKPLEIRVLPWTTNNVRGMLCAIVAVTNVTSRHYSFDILAEALVDGKYEQAFVQSNGALENSIIPGVQLVFVVPVPEESPR